jgi:two-component system sensor histidine kinase KdpD
MDNQPSADAARRPSPRPEAQSRTAGGPLLVCIDSSPGAGHLVRSASRLAEAARVEWFAVCVETPEDHPSFEDQEQIAKTLRLAAQLGGQTVMLSGFSLRDTILDFVREQGVAKIVLEQRRQPGWRRLLSLTLADQLRRRANDLDFYLIAAAGEEPRPRGAPRGDPWRQVRDYGLAAAGVGLCTGLALALFPYLALTNLVMIYLLTVVLIAAVLDQGPSIFASLVGVAVFAYCFVPDYYSFSLANTEYAITLMVMLIVSILISRLTSRIRYQAGAASHQERQTAALYDMSRNLTTKLSLAELLPEAIEQISRTFDSQVAILMPDGAGKLYLSAGEAFPDDYGSEMLVANWVYRYGHFAGLGTKTLPKARGFYLPLRASQELIGVLRLEPTRPNQMIELKSLRFLEALGSQVALAIEREHLHQQTHQTQVQIEAERLRNALLSSVSHDLRTPLTVIAGSASTLLEGEANLDPTTKAELTQTIYDEANRLDRLVHNLLEMSRLQSGQTKLNFEWHVLEEVVGCALAQLEAQLQNHPVVIHLPADLPLVSIDALLMERVFINLLENAIKYTPEQTPVEISGWLTQQELLLEVADRGPGLVPGDEELVFEKFYQAGSGSARGVGLGLTICRSIIEAHKGHIWAANRPGGGATFRFTLPLEEGAPLLDKTLPEMQKDHTDESARSVN